MSARRGRGARREARPGHWCCRRCPTAWGSPARIVLRAVPDARTGCVEIDLSVRCVPGREVAAEEPLGFRRIVTLPEPASYDDLELRVRGRVGADLQSAPQRGPARGRDCVVERQPRPAVLGARRDRRRPRHHLVGGPLRPDTRSSTLRWVGTRTVSDLQLRLLPDADARLPDRAHAELAGRQP